MNLYEISKAIDEVAEMVDEDGVLLPEAEEALTNLEMTRVEKFRNLWGLCKNIKANIDMLDAEKKILTAKKKIQENKLERIKKWIFFVMTTENLPKYDAWIFNFSLRNWSSVQIVDGTELPKEYTKVTIEPKKTELKKAIQEGKEIEWVSIVKTKSLTIK